MSAPMAIMTPEEEAKQLLNAKRPVQPAKFISSHIYHHNHNETGFDINELKYKVPLKHDPKDEEMITITVRVVLQENTDGGDETPQEATEVKVDKEKPIVVYLVGGPGSDNPATANPEVTKYYLERGFQMLFMDYRGMGGSNLLRADHLNTGAEAFFQGKAQAYENDDDPALRDLDPDTQAKRLLWFRQDNMVRDLEAVRKHLVGRGISGAKKWTIAGQSYGGWLSFTYLSFYPEALHMALITGGIPPVGQHPDTVYRNTYKTTIKACEDFYKKYKGHEKHVRDILEAIYRLGGQKGIEMPGGGRLTPERFLCLGRTLGTTNGNERVHKALTMCTDDLGLTTKEGEEPSKKKPLEQCKFSNATLLNIESWLRFEERPLYAILQEAIYTGLSVQGSNWSAERVGREIAKESDHYWWLEEGAFQKVFAPKEGEEQFRKEHFDDKPIYMSAEHVYCFHFDQYQALKPLKEAAKLLAKKADWPPLFDMKQLRNNKVPVSSLSYEKDMFIDWELSKKTANSVMGIRDDLLIDWENPGDTADKPGHIKIGHSKELMHTALKDQTDKVMPRLWEYLGKAVEGATGTKFGADPKAVDLIAALENHQE